MTTPGRSDRESGAELLAIEPLTVRISMPVQLTGISRSRLYELIQSGDLEAVKIGRSTLIPFKSLKALTGSQSVRVDGDGLA